MALQKPETPELVQLLPKSSRCDGQRALPKAVARCGLTGFKGKSTGNDGFHQLKSCFSPPARWGLLDFMSVACSSPPLLSSSSCSTATLDAQCSLSDLNHDHPRPVFPAGPQPRPSPPSVPCRTSTTTIHAQCSLPDLNREYPRQVFPAGPHVGRYGTKNVQKKVRKNVRQVCYILLANSRVCGRVTGAMPLLTLQVAKFEAISLNRWQSHWGGQRHFHFCTFGAVCKDAWDRQHLTASYYKLLEVISCWIDAWDSQHHTGFLLCITAMVAWWICDIGTFVAFSHMNPLRTIFPHRPSSEVRNQLSHHKSEKSTMNPIYHWFILFKWDHLSWDLHHEKTYHWIHGIISHVC